MRLPETNKDYYLLVNHEKLMKKAQELGYDNVIPVGDDGITDEEIEAIKYTHKGVGMVMYPMNSKAGGKSLGKLKRAGIRCVSTTYMHLEDEDEWIVTGSDDNDSMLEEDALQFAVEHFPTPERLEKTLKDRGAIRSAEYKNRCGNCQSLLGEEDKYCKRCGTKRGEGTFKPFYDEVRYAYGPPTQIKTKCTACGYVWITGGLGSDPSGFCPNCGKSGVSVLWTKEYEWAGLNEFFGDDKKPAEEKETGIKGIIGKARKAIVAGRKRRKK